MISWLYREGGYGMIKVLEVLLRSNFRCGRMLYSRADAVVGCFRAPSSRITLAAGDALWEKLL